MRRHNERIAWVASVLMLIKAIVEPTSPGERLPDAFPDEFIPITSTFYYQMSPPQGPQLLDIPNP